MGTGTGLHQSLCLGQGYLVCNYFSFKEDDATGREEGNVLFNDTLNTFYLWLYGVGHMVKCHSDKKEETCFHHMGYTFRSAARFFYKHHPTDRIAHTIAFVTPVVEHWLLK